MFGTILKFARLEYEVMFRFIATPSLAVLLTTMGSAQTYEITDLGTLPGGTFSEASGIDAFGRVTGNSDGANGVIHAFLYRDGTMFDLGALAGGNSSSRSFGLGISERKGEGRHENNRREERRRDEVLVTGYSEAGPFSYDHAFLYHDGTMLDLGTLPGGVSSQGYGVNEFGQVVGGSSVTEFAFGVTHAFLYSRGQMRDLGTLEPGGGNSSATAINRSAEVTGFSSTAEGGTHAFLYRDGQMSDLGTLPGGIESFGQAINDAGQVAGASGTTSFGNFHAFLYSDGAMLDLGTLPQAGDSFAFGINRLGEVVGSAGITPGSRSPSHAFLYRNGRMHDLNRLIRPDSGWVLENAAAVNDKGQITGTGLLNGATRAYLLTPVCSEHRGDGADKHCELEPEPRTEKRLPVPLIILLQDRDQD